MKHKIGKKGLLSILLAVALLLSLFPAMGLAAPATPLVGSPETANPLAEPGGNPVWNYRSPLPAANIIENAEYINGKYMAVGYKGTLISSVDGLNWQKVPVGADSDRLTGIAFGSGKYVIVGNASDFVARIYTSSDGQSWQETASIANHGLYDVAYGNDGFVAVGQSGKILRSADGEDWEIITVNPMDYTLLGVTYGDGKYVASGMRKHTGISQRGAVMTSVDGQNWTVTHTNANNVLWDISYGGGTFVVVGGNDTGSYYTCTSSDGVAWSARSGPSYAQLFAVNYDGSKFIAVGRTNPSSSNKAFTTVSSNGINWTDSTDITKLGLSAVAGKSDGTQHVAMGGPGNIYSSADGGATWIYRTLGGTKNLKDVAWNGSLYVAVGLEGFIQTSADGESWTTRTSGTTNDLNRVEYLNNQFIAVGKGGTILTSADGTAWTVQTSGTGNDLLDIAYGEGLYVTGGNTVARISNDGINWRAPAAGLITLKTVAYGDGVFVALSQYGSAYSSADGENWSNCGELDRFAKYPTKMIYADGKFVAVGGYGEIFISSDEGENWTIVESGLTVYLQDLVYAGGNFAAVGGMGYIIASTDGGTTWTVQPSGLIPGHIFGADEGTELFGIAAGDSSFVAVGANGITLQSENFEASTDRDAHDVALARPILGISNILGSGVNYNESYIVANMNLPTTGNFGTVISWTSSKPEYIAVNGQVTRPPYAVGDQVVYLTATISKGSASTTKNFIVIAIAQPDPDIGIVEQALSALTFDVIKGSNSQTNNITSNLNLITDGGNGTTVSWNSNKPATIATDGTVTRPAQGAGDESVTLTATVSKGNVTRTKSFNLTVKALANQDVEDVAAAKTALTFDAIKGNNSAENNIQSNLNLITTGENGTTISWSSTKPATIAADGTVTRPAQGEADVTVTLTATISKDSASDTKTFDLTVKAKTVLDVSGIAVKSQPADLIYTAGETLDLSGLEVTLTYLDSASLDVGWENFSSMGISTNPTHGTTLSVASHHNQPVAVTCNGKTAHTANLTVTEAAGATLEITSSSLPDATHNVPYSFQLSASGGEPPYRWSATGLPPGLTLSESGLISGTPSLSGMYYVDLTVQDNANHSISLNNLFFGVLVNPSGPVAAGTATPLTVTEGIYGENNGVVTFSHKDSYHSGTNGYIVVYQWIFMVHEKDHPEIDFQNVAWETLPVNQYSADGKVWQTTDPDATPQYTYLLAGNYHAALRVFDDSNNYDITVFDITVNPSLVIDTASLPGCTTGVAYSHTLQGSGGMTPYTWQASGLPPGLSIDSSTGVISGTPTTPGTYPVTLTLQDVFGGDMRIANKNLSLTINADSSGGGGGGDSTPPANTTTITANQIESHLNSSQPIELRHEGLQITIDPEDLPAQSSGGSIRVQTTSITDPNALNSFFVQYPGQQGIMRAFSVTFSQVNSSGQTEEITQLNGEITLTFQLTAEELAGIDPSTLVVYKRAEDGSISEFSPVFDWTANSLSITTSHLCEFFIMGDKGIPTQRLAGENRYATAAAISAQGWQTADTVILASGEKFPDALTGTVLAAMKSAPVLLTAQSALSSQTLAEIKRLKAKHIYLIGGTGVISQEIEDLLAQDYSVTRVFGGDRYETAVKAGELVVSEATDTAVIATGTDYPDALSVASFAGQNGLPILFTPRDELHSLTAQALSKWGIKKVILVGGTSVISAQIEKALQEDMNLSVTRLGGKDRYRTSLEIAKYFTGSKADPLQDAALATGSMFPDALAGASLAAKLKMPVLLCGKDQLSPEIEAYLKGLSLKKVYIFGGEGAVSDRVKDTVSKMK